MFCLLFLLRGALASTSADLVAPFEMDEDGKIGYWEFGGSVIVEDTQIRLVPPVQFKRGSAWTNVEVPSGKWTLRVELAIDEGTGGGGAAIWFVDDYRATGELNGGPRKFTGIGVILTIVDGGYAIDASVIENTGNSLAYESRGIRLEIDGRDTVVAEVELDMDRKTVAVAVRNGPNAIKLPAQSLTVDLSESYIGITAQCDQLTSRIDLVGVSFQLDPRAVQGEARNVAAADASHGGDYVPETRSILRNPVFSATERVFAAMERGGFEQGVSTDMVLDIVNELSVASNAVASFADLNSFVAGTMMGYTQKWHKRTMRIIDQVRHARNVMGAAWNYTNNVVEALSAATKRNSARTVLRVVDMAELFTEETGKMDQDTEQAISGRGTPVMTMVFVGMAAVELVFVIIFVILLQSADFREKYLGISSM